MKLVSAAGVAPAITRAQTEHVAATLRAVAPANGWRRGLGSCGDGRTLSLEHSVHRRLADPKGLAPSAFPQTTGCSAKLSYESKWPAEPKLARTNDESPSHDSLRRDSLHLPQRSERRLVGSGGNAPLVTSDFVLRHWFYRPAAGTLPVVALRKQLVAGVGVTPT